MAKGQKEVLACRHGLSLLYNNPVPEELTLLNQSASTPSQGASSDLRSSNYVLQACLWDLNYARVEKKEKKKVERPILKVQRKPIN